MSEAVKPTRKVSREGIVLIKSFEGFRPRAVARPEGGWIIGYGHTLSAREGATVSEADAELLLRYDLLAIEQRLNATAAATLNQHQFDALASFAFSVGLDRFEGSDVLSRVTVGDQGAAAEALLGWPETRSPSAGARRRAAERALFTADPARPVALADLLAAPVGEDVAAAPSETMAGQADEAPDAATDVPATQTTDSDAASVPSLAVAPRVAAVAALLGEAETALVGPAVAPIVPTFETVATPSRTEPTQAPVEPSPLPVDIAANDAEPTTSAERDDASAPGQEPSPGPVPTEIAPAPQPGLQTDAPAPQTAFSSGPVGEGPASTLALNARRYSPYGAPIVGPLPGTADIAQPQPAEPVESLVLTSPEDLPTPVVVRPTWSADERESVETTPAGESLFGEDLILTRGGQPLGRPDFEPEAPQRFDWSETGAFIVMGAVGLTAFGASMAAFRLASEQGGGDETSIIGWVLALIGVACVGVSSFNLYRKFGLAGPDR